MKKSFLLLTVLLAISGATIFASPITKTDPRTESSFQKQFAGATHVQWSTIEGGYLQAAFNWADHRTIAYFSPDGEFLGSIRNLFFNQLPLSVMRSIESNFGSESIIEVSEITNEEGTLYSALLEQKDRKYKVKLNSLGEIVQKIKIKK